MRRGLTAAAKKPLLKTSSYRSTKALRHPKSSARSSFSAACLGESFAS